MEMISAATQTPMPVAPHTFTADSNAGEKQGTKTVCLNFKSNCHAAMTGMAQLLDWNRCRCCHQEFQRQEIDIVPATETGTCLAIQPFSIRNGIADTVFALRTSKGWSQLRLATLMGMPRSHVYKVEMANVTPALKCCIKFAEAFGISPYQFFCIATRNDPERIARDFVKQITSDLLAVKPKDRERVLSVFKQISESRE
jgi:transcriptional regulator with XRE-family HTH domain